MKRSIGSTRDEKCPIETEVVRDWSLVIVVHYDNERPRWNYWPYAAPIDEQVPVAISVVFIDKFSFKNSKYKILYDVDMYVNLADFSCSSVCLLNI